MLITTLLFPLLLVLATPPVETLKPGELKQFEAAKAAAAGDAEKLVSLALWCEMRGLSDERERLLAQALKIDPDHAIAHSLQRQAEHEGQWQTPGQVAEQVRADAALTAKLAEYNARRAKLERAVEYEASQTASLKERGFTAGAEKLRARLDRKLAPAHIKLGLWCEKNGLKAEALANFTAAVHIDPHNENTWRHLGYIRHNGEWMSHEQVAAAKAEADAQQHADHHWEPLFHKWEFLLDDPKRKDEAEANFSTVNDPRAVPSIARVFAARSPAGQELAIRLLSRIDSPGSTKELSAIAIFGANEQIRHDASLALKGREPRDYGERLVNMIHTSWTYEARPPQGPGTEGYLVVDSPRFRVTRTYKAPQPFKLASNFHGYIGYGPDGLPCVVSGNALRAIDRRSDSTFGFESEAAVLRRGEEAAMEMIATANLESVAARQRLLADIKDIETNNATSVELNRRVRETLTTSLDAPTTLANDDEDGWRTWYYERVGYRYTPPPKAILAKDATPGFTTPTIVSCFAAGTPVVTMTGARPIETLQVGDRVLSQDVVSGKLTYQPVLVVHHNPPDKTLKVALENGDSVVASLFHRFWIAGRGWSMARDLEVGQVLRTLDGPSRITSLEEAPVQPVFNLDVASSRTYFVGSSSMLVHDNTLPPAHAEGPTFDVVPALASLGR